MEQKTLSYPEHEKLFGREAEMELLGLFLDHLQKRGITLGIWSEHNELMPAREDLDMTIAAYFGIDLVKFEAEKREILETMRALRSI